MLRKVVLIVMAVVVSYGLAVLAGYILYTNSSGRTEAHLSVVVRLVVNPLIALLVGGTVGLLSKDRPIATSAVGLAPWAIMLLSPYKPVSISDWLGWVVPVLVYIPLGAAAATSVWRVRRKFASQSGLLA